MAEHGKEKKGLVVGYDAHGALLGRETAGKRIMKWGYRGSAIGLVAAVALTAAGALPAAALALAAVPLGFATGVLGDGIDSIQKRRRGGGKGGH